MSRRARNPMLVVAAVALVPAVGLGALAAVAAANDAAVAVPVTSTTVASVLPDALATPVLSIRRAPTPLADDRRTDVVTDAMQPMAGAVDPTSCFAASLDGERVAGTNTDQLVIPASSLKVAVATAAVEALGAGSVFTTRVVGPAPVGGVVDGDVYFVGGGDPLLSEQWYTQPSATRKRPPLNATSMEALADAVVAAGITSINDDVLGDGSRYDDERHPPGWSSEIQATIDGVPVGALVVNDSTNEGGAIASDPAEHAASVLRRMLRDRGVTVAGDAGTGVAPTDLAALATVTSQPLSAVVGEMLTTSDNLTAEMLVKEIGVATAGAGTRVDGLRAVGERMVSWGIAPDSFVLTDGSGLSRDNLISCASLLAVLARGDSTDVVGAGLARAGQDGSTLDGRFEQPGLAGVLQAKTGSLTGVKALAGYFPVDGGEVEFVLILNGPSAANFAAPWDALGAALLATTGSPAADALAPPATASPA